LRYEEIMARRLPPVVDLPSVPIADIPALGKLVRNQRAIHVLRIDDAAALCGVSSNVLSRLENGKPVTLDKLLLVLHGLGLHMLVLPAGKAHALKPALQSLLPNAETTT
jgi:transcriptional regulator with XRE-family HTH domain